MWFELLDEDVELVYNKRKRKYDTDFMTSQEHRLISLLRQLRLRGRLRSAGGAAAAHSSAAGCGVLS